MVENLPANAGDTGSGPGLGRLQPVLRNGRGRDSERPAHRDEAWPSLATTRESPRTDTKTQRSHK